MGIKKTQLIESLRTQIRTLERTIAYMLVELDGLKKKLKMMEARSV